jgi:uncharacterized membrane protein (DUF4010 family)
MPESPDLTLQLRFVMALLLSFVMGLERESVGLKKGARGYAGVRTYTLIGLLGFGCAWLHRVGVVGALPVGLTSLTAMALVGYLSKSREGHIGWTSEVAALLTFVLGALCLLAEAIWLPMALGIISTFLLSEKSELEKQVERLDQVEFLAVLKFLIVSVVILPVLPDQKFSPFPTETVPFEINPRKVWLIVVMVSSIGFAGYFLSKKFGSKAGLWLSGLLGGIVSSTAVSVAAGRIAQRAPEQRAGALQASLLASSVMYPRILALIWFIHSSAAPLFGWKLLTLAAVGLALALYIRKDRTEEKSDAAPVQPSHNPFEIKPALVFAFLFIVLSVGTAFVKTIYGGKGLLTLSAIIGVTDIDPFILSLVSHAGAVEHVVVQAVLIAMMSNTIVKGIYFGTLSKESRGAAGLRYGILAACHLPLILIS